MRSFAMLSPDDVFCIAVLRSARRDTTGNNNWLIYKSEARE
jgi:hypothetical protein